MKLLVVEDEHRMTELLRQGLEEEGHAVQCAFDGRQGLERARGEHFDGIILDIMMPELNGFEVAALLRAEGNATPVLMLTAKDSVPDIVRGLDLGADDYLTKPFSFTELLLRLHAIRRRTVGNQSTKLAVADLRLDVTDHSVTRGGIPISLTKTEYKILERLISKAGRIVARDELILSVWGEKSGIESNTLDAFVRLLRQKVDLEGRQKLIHTVRGTGYMVRAEEQI
jgi:DNA-binding response OmpR family regulator